MRDVQTEVVRRSAAQGMTISPRKTLRATHS